MVNNDNRWLLPNYNNYNLTTKYNSYSNDANKKKWLVNNTNSNFDQKSSWLQNGGQQQQQSGQVWLIQNVDYNLSTSPWSSAEKKGQKRKWSEGQEKIEPILKHVKSILTSDPKLWLWKQPIKIVQKSCWLNVSPLENRTMLSKEITQDKEGINNIIGHNKEIEMEEGRIKENKILYSPTTASWLLPVKGVNNDENVGRTQDKKESMNDIIEQQNKENEIGEERIKEDKILYSPTTACWLLPVKEINNENCNKKLSMKELEEAVDEIKDKKKKNNELNKEFWLMENKENLMEEKLKQLSLVNKEKESLFPLKFISGPDVELDRWLISKN